MLPLILLMFGWRALRDFAEIWGWDTGSEYVIIRCCATIYEVPEEANLMTEGLGLIMNHIFAGMTNDTLQVDDS